MRSAPPRDQEIRLTRAAQALRRAAPGWRMLAVEFAVVDGALLIEGIEYSPLPGQPARVEYDRESLVEVAAALTALRVLTGDGWQSGRLSVERRDGAPDLARVDLA